MQMQHIGVTLTFNLAVTMIVRDNGRGFRAAAISGDTHGAATMRERADMMGGYLEVESHARGGTTIRLVAP